MDCKASGDSSSGGGLTVSCQASSGTWYTAPCRAPAPTPAPMPAPMPWPTPVPTPSPAPAPTGSLTLAMVGDSICRNGSEMAPGDHMGWCDLLDTSSQDYLSGVWSSQKTMDAGVGGLQVFQFHQCLSPTHMPPLGECWSSLQAKNPEYVLWNLGEDDQGCHYYQPYSSLSNAQECVQQEFIPEMSAMINQGSYMKHILVTPAPLIESERSLREPSYGAYRELIAANHKLASVLSSVVAVLPLWEVLDCYYDGLTDSAVTELKQSNQGSLDNRHTTKCGAAVHNYALLHLLNGVQLAGLHSNTRPVAAYFDQMCAQQDRAKLKQCISSFGNPAFV